MLDDLPGLELDLDEGTLASLLLELLMLFEDSTDLRDRLLCLVSEGMFSKGSQPLEDGGKVYFFLNPILISQVGLVYTKTRICDESCNDDFLKVLVKGSSMTNYPYSKNEMNQQKASFIPEIFARLSLPCMRKVS